LLFRKEYSALSLCRCSISYSFLSLCLQLLLGDYYSTKKKEEEDDEEDRIHRKKESKQQREQ